MSADFEFCIKEGHQGEGSVSHSVFRHCRGTGCQPHYTHSSSHCNMLQSHTKPVPPITVLPMLLHPITLMQSIYPLLEINNGYNRDPYNDK